MRRRLARWAFAGWTALVCAACEGADAHPLLAIRLEAHLLGLLFLDQNGNTQLDPTIDQPVKGWPVRLLSGNGAVVASTTSDSTGAFRFAAVPPGRFRVDVDRSRLGDTLEVFGLFLGRDVTLAALDTTPTLVSIGFTYPKVALGAVDTVPVGRRIFVEGIALNSIGATGTRDLHLRSGGDALRTTNVVRRAVALGDSVRLLGRRATEAGWAILTGAEIIPIRSVADPEALELTTRAASTAQQNAVAADLARIRNADLQSARNELSDVILTVDDGTGPTEILLRSFLGTDASFFRPDSVRVREAVGLLVPYLEGGQTRWRVAPRSAADLRMEAERRTASAPGKGRRP